MAKQIFEWCMPGHGGISSSNVVILTPSDPDELTPHWPTGRKGISLIKGIQNWRTGKEVFLES